MRSRSRRKAGRRKAPSIPKHRRGNIRGDPLSSAPQPPLSPREQEILSLCLQSSEDPRDIGMLIALLAVERKQSAAKEPAS